LGGLEWECFVRVRPCGGVGSCHKACIRRLEKDGVRLPRESVDLSDNDAPVRYFSQDMLFMMDNLTRRKVTKIVVESGKKQIVPGN